MDLKCCRDSLRKDFLNTLHVSYQDLFKIIDQLGLGEEGEEVDGEREIAFLNKCTPPPLPSIKGGRLQLQIASNQSKVVWDLARNNKNLVSYIILFIFCILIHILTLFELSHKVKYIFF